MVEDGKGVLYAIDGFTHESFSNAKKVMDKRDVDLPVLVTGYPGTGKSTLTMQLATFVDPTFNEERMCQNVSDFIEQIKKAKPKQAVALDESYEGLNSSEVRREVGRALLNLLNIVRQKNLYLFLIIPNFFDMSKQIAVFRTRWLVHCYDKSFGDIGYYCLFDKSTKHSLYIKGKRDENYNAIKADFFCSFSPFIPTQINYEKYLKMKSAGLYKVAGKRESINRFQIQRDNLVIWLRELGKPATQIAEKIGLKRQMIYNILDKRKLEDEFKEDIERQKQNPLITRKRPLRKIEDELEDEQTPNN